MNKKENKAFNIVEKFLLGRICISFNGFIEIQTMNEFVYLEDSSNKLCSVLEDFNEQNEGPNDILMDDNIQGTLIFKNSLIQLVYKLPTAFLCVLFMYTYLFVYICIYFFVPIFGWFLF